MTQGTQCSLGGALREVVFGQGSQAGRRGEESKGGDGLDCGMNTRTGGKGGCGGNESLAAKEDAGSPRSSTQPRTAWSGGKASFGVAQADLGRWNIWARTGHTDNHDAARPLGLHRKELSL